MNAKKIHTDEGRTVSVGIESEWKPLSFVQAAGCVAMKTCKSWTSPWKIVTTHLVS